MKQFEADHIPDEEIEYPSGVEMLSWLPIKAQEEFLGDLLAENDREITAAVVKGLANSFIEEVLYNDEWLRNQWWERVGRLEYEK